MQSTHSRTQLAQSRKLTKLAAALLSGFAALFTSQDASAQSSYELWVNPQTGNDATGTPNLPSLPYKTITGALLDAPDYSIIRALPGIYSDDPIVGNGEQFPIYLKDGISLIGTGAKECTLRNTTLSSVATNQFIPVKPRGSSAGTYHKIIDLSHADGAPITIRGFTFQGADIQIATWAEQYQSVHITNCLFDMVTIVGETGTLGAFFGILLAPIWDSSLPQEDKYNQLSYFIYNNTFIQGAVVGDAETQLHSISYSVAICNVGDPADSHAPDNDPAALHGPSDLSVQNNLIRHLPGAWRCSMLGIDYGDTAIKAYRGTAPGPTNAFDPSSAVSGTSFFTSEIVGNPATFPVAKVSINGPGVSIDPGFVGEMISQTQSATLPNPMIRDWRLLPDSALVNQGSGPVQSWSLHAQILEAVNGLTDVFSTFNKNSSFHWDGEGHGNPRIRGGFPDIGFDETNILLISGCYGNDSKSHDTPFDQTIEPGNPTRIIITPEAGTALLRTTSSPYFTGVGWTVSPGTLDIINPNYNIAWLDPALVVNSGTLTLLSASWTNPVDGSLHTWGQATINAPDAGGPPFHYNQQIGFLPISNPNPVLSNLQFEMY